MEIEGGQEVFGDQDGFAHDPFSSELFPSNSFPVAPTTYPSEDTNTVQTNESPMTPAETVASDTNDPSQSEKRQMARNTKPRKKLWQCIYPGCCEGPMTHYNCHSHVWDAHLRDSLPEGHPLRGVPYKNVEDRATAKKMCTIYVSGLSDSDKRKKPRLQKSEHEGSDEMNSSVQTESNAGESGVKREHSEGAGESTEEECVEVLDENNIVRVVKVNPELARLHVCGEVFSEKGFLQRSDARFKEDIAPISGALEKVLSLTGKTFRYKGDPKRKMGFIAQELEAVVPTAVLRDEKGLSVDVVSLVPLILEALKELHTKTQQEEDSKNEELKAAIGDALKQVAELDKKLESLRQEEDNDSDSDYDSESDSDDDDDDLFSGAVDLERALDHDGGYLPAGSLGSSESDLARRSGKKGKRKGKKKGKKGQKDDDGKDSLGSTTNKNKFRYSFEFGPPLMTCFMILFFTMAGAIAFKVLPVLPFVWIFCWFFSVILAVSLIKQRHELVSTFRDKHIEMKWTPSMTLNSFAFCALALIGIVFTLILGVASIVFNVLFTIVLIFLWFFAVFANHRYHVRIQSLLVVFFGILVIGSFLFSMLFVAQPYECSLQGYENSPESEIQVRLGSSIKTISLNEIPWNCFYREVSVSNPLPSNLSINSVYTPPYIHGAVTVPFASKRTEVILRCNKFMQFSCGSVTFRMCPDYKDIANCSLNGCAWCSTSNTSDEGRCDYCTNEFTDECHAQTGLNPVCFAPESLSDVFSSKRH